jgi:hypothetical protein
MWKAVLVGTTALALTGTSIVYAQQRPRGPEAQTRSQSSQEDAAAFADARIAALKAGLRLTAEQEKNWSGFESALRDFAKSRMEQAQARRTAQPPADPIERLRRQADTLSTAGAALKRLADTEEPLYKSLDEGQKHRFHALSRLLGPRQMRFAGHERGGRDWRGNDRENSGQGGRNWRGNDRENSGQGGRNWRGNDRDNNGQGGQGQRGPGPRGRDSL